MDIISKKWCENIVVELVKPKEIDFDVLKWIICHENTFVYIDQDGIIQAVIRMPCDHINQDACNIKDGRPEACDDKDNVKYFSDDFCKRKFETIAEIEEFEKELKKKTKEPKKQYEYSIAPCFSCDSSCCKHLTLDVSDITWDWIQWYACHKDACVYIDDKDNVFLQVNAPCRFVKDGKCSLPEKPSFCRNLKTDTCEKRFLSFEELRDHLKLVSWP